MMNDAKALMAELSSFQTVGLLSHQRPDADALGSSLALAEILEDHGVQTVVFNTDGVPEHLSFLPQADRCVSDVSALRPCEALVLLDCGFRHRTGEADAPIWQCSVFVIDHHESICDDMAGDSIHKPEASSTAELVYEIGDAVGFDWTTSAASNLFVGMHTDTGGFRYSKTTASTLHAAANLLDVDIDFDDLLRKLYEEQPLRVFRLKNKVLGECEFFFEQRVGVVSISQRQRSLFRIAEDELLVFVNSVRAVEGVRLAIQLDEIAPKLTKVSFRSDGSYDVAEIASEFGGGGHERAAGCRIETSLSAAQREVIKVVGEVVESPDVHRTKQ